jgi:hypothetical protein
LGAQDRKVSPAGRYRGAVFPANFADVLSFVDMTAFSGAKKQARREAEPFAFST